jgi:hypothetical protein
LNDCNCIVIAIIALSQCGSNLTKWCPSQSFPDEVSENRVFFLLHRNSGTGWTKFLLTGLQLNILIWTRTESVLVYRILYLAEYFLDWVRSWLDWMKSDSVLAWSTLYLAKSWLDWVMSESVLVWSTLYLARSWLNWVKSNSVLAWSTLYLAKSWLDWVMSESVLVWLEHPVLGQVLVGLGDV